MSRACSLSLLLLISLPAAAQSVPTDGPAPSSSATPVSSGTQAGGTQLDPQAPINAGTGTASPINTPAPSLDPVPANPVISGTDGDLVWTEGAATLTGTVTGDLHILGGELIIDGAWVQGDLTVDGGTVTLTNLVVEGDLEIEAGVVKAQQVSVDGDISVEEDGRLHLTDSSVLISGGDLELELDAGGVISGQLIAAGELEIESEGDLLLDGAVEADEVKIEVEGGSLSLSEQASIRWIEESELEVEGGSLFFGDDALVSGSFELKSDPSGLSLTLDTGPIQADGTGLYDDLVIDEREMTTGADWRVVFTGPLSAAEGESFASLIEGLVGVGIIQADVTGLYDDLVIDEREMTTGADW